MNLELLKTLRHQTGAGVLDCKEALSEANGSLSDAVDILRKKGIAKASKKSHRDVKEGLVVSFISEDSKSGVVAEINCETDFVARNKVFSDLTQKVLAMLSTGDISNFDSNGLLKDGQLKKEITTLLQESVVTLGESIQFARAVRLDSDGFLSTYVHLGGKIGVLLDVSGAYSEKKDILKDVCMHIAASSPLYLKKEDVPESLIEKEKDIILAQNKDKPSQFLDKIIAGKIQKYFSEICLIEQNFVKDPSQKMKTILGDVAVNRFIRFELGS